MIENPPEVPIETPHETPPCPDPPDPKPSKATKRKTAVPDVLSESDQARVAAWAAKRSPPITPEQLEYGWEVYRAKARSNGYRYVDQAQAFMNAMGATGEAWALKGFGANARPGESAAEAKSRRIKENAREALRRHQARKAGSTDQPPLIAIQGSGQ